MDAMNENRLLVDMKRAAALLSVSVSTLFNWINVRSKYYKQNLPKRVSAGGRKLYFVYAELVAYIDHMRANRDFPDHPSI